MKQGIIGGYYDLLHTTTTEYNCLFGGASWETNPDRMAQCVSSPGTIRNLRIELNDVPGTGTYVFTLYLDHEGGGWGTTVLTCEVAANGTIASDTLHDVAVSAGDVVCLECNPDSPDNARYALWTAEFEGDNANESLILSVARTVKDADEYSPFMGYGWQALENDVRQVCPTSGIVKNLYVQLEDDPGTAPDAYRYTLRVNGANSQDPGDSNNPLQVTVVANNKTGFDTTHEIPVSAGDILTLKMEPISTPSVGNIWTAIGMTFVADTNGESLIMGGSYSNLDDTDTEYNSLVGGYIYWTITESLRYNLAQECIFKKLYMLLSGVPGGGNKYVFTVRHDGGSPVDGLEVEIADAAITGNDTTHEISVLDGKTVALECNPDGTPTVRDAYWGLVCYISAAQVYEESCSDGFNIGEPAVIATLTLDLSVTDGLSSGDTPIGIPTFLQTATDGLELAETLSILFTTNPVATDGINAGDAPVTQLTAQSLASDGMILGDTPLGSLVISLTLTDGSTMGDSTVIGLAFTPSVSDGLSAGDTPAVTLTIPCNITDGTVLSDTLSTLLESYLALSDGLKVGDTPATQCVLRVTTADGIQLSDTLATGVILGIVLADGLKLGDATQVGLVYQLLSQDGFKIGDTPAGIFLINLLCTDGLVLSDAAIKTILLGLRGRYGLKPAVDTGNVISRSERYGVKPAKDTGSIVPSSGERYG